MTSSACHSFMAISFALFHLSTVMSENQPFCQMYANNRYRINYGFQRVTEQKEEFFLIIGDDCWQLEINPDSEVSAVRFKAVNQSESIASKGIVNHWAANNRTQTEESALMAVIFKGLNLENTCLLNQVQWIWHNWTRTYRCYDGTTEKTSEESEASKQRFDKLKAEQSDSVFDLAFEDEGQPMITSGQKEVIAIFRKSISETDHIYVFILQENKELIYCVKDHGLYNLKCNNLDYSLTDCSPYHLPTRARPTLDQSEPITKDELTSEATQPEKPNPIDRQKPTESENRIKDLKSEDETQKRKKMWSYLLIALVLIVLIAIIIAAVVYFTVRSNESPATPEEKPMPSQPIPSDQPMPNAKNTQQVGPSGPTEPISESNIGSEMSVRSADIE